MENTCFSGIFEHYKLSTQLHIQLLIKLAQESEIFHCKSKDIEIDTYEKIFNIVQASTAELPQSSTIYLA